MLKSEIKKAQKNMNISFPVPVYCLLASEGQPLIVMIFNPHDQ